jgi:hypothetical protein
MPRPYNKKAPYWNERKNISKIPAPEPQKREQMPTFAYEMGGGDHYTSVAACGGGSPTSTRDGSTGSIIPANRFANINAGGLPWEVSAGQMSVSNAILTCQRAYANVGVFRNAIESSTEFSTSTIHFKTANSTVKGFFDEWSNRIKLLDLENQFFREYYRSGNVFLYRFNGRIEESKYGQMKRIMGAKSPVIPIRYVVLNPAQVYLNSGISYNNNYVKMLSKYEVEQLKNPQTPEDKQVFNSLPEAVKKTLKSGGSYANIFIPLDPNRLRFAFYKKQSYEPLAIPMGYPILNDIDWKLELKKMDMSLSKTIEQVILLITTGEKVDQYGGGVNPENLKNLQTIFRNQTIGRVLVADHTTRGEWLIPDLGSLLGPEKYIQVEKDIREGLQSIMGGADEKFANAAMKAKIFIERLKEGQKLFLENFLIPEIKTICEAMNFKNVPEVEFEQIDLGDSTQRERIYLRLAELGILSPDEVFTALETGVLPEQESNEINQGSYKKLRDKGYYLPLLGGATNAPEQAGGNGRPAGTKSPQTTKKVSPIGTKGALSMSKILDLSLKASKTKEDVVKEIKGKYKLLELTDAQLAIANDITTSLISNEQDDEWFNKVAEYVDDPKDINKEFLTEAEELAKDADLDVWNSMIVLKAGYIKDFERSV